MSSVQSITLIAKSWQACLSNFLKSNAWDTNILNKILFSLSRKHFSAINYIALDWTALVKSGKSFNFVGDVYDGRDGKIKNGFPLLLALGIAQGKNLILPLLDKITSWNHPEFKSENKIIISVLNNLKEHFLSEPSSTLAKNKDLLAKIIFLLDAGFYGTILIKHLLKLEISFIINAQGNRNIILTDKKTGGKIETKLENLEQGYYEKVHIKHLRRQMTVAVYCEENKKGEFKKRILVSNLKNQNLEKMKQAYKHRWAIEEYFKELKGKYDLENFRVRGFEAIERVVKMILIANAMFTNSLVTNSHWREKIMIVIKNFLNLKDEIKKKEISLFREIARRLANFGQTDDFTLVLNNYQLFLPCLF